MLYSTINTKMLPSFSSKILQNMLNQTSSLLNINKEGVTLSKGSLKQLLFLVEQIVSNAHNITTKMSIHVNSSFFKNSCLFHNVLDYMCSATDSFLHILDLSNSWTVVTVNSIIRNMYTQKKEFSSLAKIADVVEHLDSLVLSTLRSNNFLIGRSCSFAFFLLFIVVYSFFVSSMLVYKGYIFTRFSTTFACSFTLNFLTLAAILYTSLYDTGF